MIRGVGLYGTSIPHDIGEPWEWEALSNADRSARLLDACEQLKAEPDAYLWIGLVEPTGEEFGVVAGALDLPPLLVEDATNPAHRPELELDDAGHGLVVVKILDYVDETSDVLTGQAAIFLGPQFAVTVRFGATNVLSQVRDRISTDHDLQGHGALAVLYAILDEVVDGYLRVAGEVSADVEDLETAVFAQDAAQSNADRIYWLKRETLEVRRAVSPLVPLAQDFVDGTLAWVPADLRPYFRDIGEHLLRANDSVEATDSLLMTMLMASMSLQDLQQNRDMRKISAWVAIAALPTMIAGIYGMNFDNMPELRNDWGYPVVMAVLVTSCALLWRAFKRSGWL